MTGESNLSVLLRTMQPVLHEDTFGFFTLSEKEALPLIPHSMGLFRESEGTTLILSASTAAQYSLPIDSTWSLITLSVHSSLSAIGFLATISSALAAEGISLNAVSAYYHDHLFVPYHQRSKALTVLDGLIRADVSA